MVSYTYMDTYILDTNLFFNMQAGLNFGKSTDEVIKNMTLCGKKVELFMPPRIVEEFLSFFENKEQENIKKLLAVITVKSPVIESFQFPASIFYTLVEDIRNRSYRGLRVGEEEIEQAGKSLMNAGLLSKMDFQKRVGQQIKGFRDRYRQATRVGFLDSVADLDIIVLAKETNGTVVSTDEGLLKWSRLFGVKEMSPSVFGHLHHQA
ncbi:RNA ligase partner protein [Candidatus Roizmanbacteria bacterium CG17_big_fil_post_rev_8_21_14_2_50_39_7]|uniref:RNA ligase partner protein n=2 Tax=Candidatus Roizmaniibacteriota TaxID=1752723 RepID=A0A2M7EK14_9BACT|nr:MAG: RNA ligase partner protein [Candidatus Roizmanbacteria bacterium CG03_land_8_20_14_0_80_39_12]PIV70899.1 MAG: RNA ligase partner protein [Candidatus Roizmanbacteria bacterium CG17_big_fil_post_rev_8_21_14_2_50_39_7]